MPQVTHSPLVAAMPLMTIQESSHHEQVHSSQQDQSAIDVKSTQSAPADSDIQHTLTDLLNTSQVRADPALRLLIQTQLLDAEREWRKTRRSRRGSPASLSPANSIDEHRQEEP